jgi:LmbE family N-acetylglucosaminyl deacetylase
MLRMLCVTAHPDDEAAAFGGTIRVYKERGVEVTIVCLTPGQAATHRGHARNDHELAAIRREEFAASCRILGVDRGIVLNYADGQLYRVEIYRVVEEITRYVRELRPHIMLTFGPDGAVTGHTDHSMVSVFATLAFEWAARANRFPDQISAGMRPHAAQKLYHATADFVLPERPPVSPPPATAIIQIGQHLEAKVAAFEAHATQAPVFPVVREHILARAREERFHLAAASRPMTIAIETDLFAGVVDS